MATLDKGGIVTLEELVVSQASPRRARWQSCSLKRVSSRR